MGAVRAQALPAAPAAVAVDHSPELFKKYLVNHDSVAYAAAVVNLRDEVTCRAKPGKRVEATLQADVRFSDGTVLRKGTVLEGAVASATELNRHSPLSTLVVDWTTAQMGKKQTMTLVAVTRDAVAGPEGERGKTFGRYQLGATSNSGQAGDKLNTGGNLTLLNKKVNMPQIAPGVELVQTTEHSLSVQSTKDDVVLREATQLVLVLFKARGED